MAKTSISHLIGGKLLIQLMKADQQNHQSFQLQTVLIRYNLQLKMPFIMVTKKTNSEA